MTIQRTDNEHNRNRGPFMLNLLAAMALSLAVLQAWTLLETVTDTPHSAPVTTTNNAVITVRAMQTTGSCQTRKSRDDTSLLQGYSGYLLLEHAIAGGEAFDLPSTCKPASTVPVTPVASPVKLNEQQELIQPEGVKLI